MIAFAHNYDLEGKRQRLSSEPLPALAGYVCVFGDRYWQHDPGIFESVAPGAFRAVLNRRPCVPCCIGHNTGFEIASTRDGSLRLLIDAVGLVAMVRPTTELGEDAIWSVRAGHLCGMSWRGKIQATNIGEQHRLITSVDLLEDVCLTNNPCNKRTTVVLQNESGLCASFYQDGPIMRLLRATGELP